MHSSPEPRTLFNAFARCACWSMERTIKAIADHGAAFMGSVVLHLKDGTRTHFFEYLAQEFPALVPKYQRLYQSRAYVPKAYAAEVRSVMELLQTRYGLKGRESREEAAPVTTSKPAQPALDWSSES